MMAKDKGKKKKGKEKQKLEKVQAEVIIKGDASAALLRMNPSPR